MSMRIALVSYEFPPCTGGGGIGTYMLHAARMLAERGHSIELFVGAGKSLARTSNESGILIHRIGSTLAEFKENIGDCIAGCHSRRAFDVAECPEIAAQAHPVRHRLPNLPIVVKLHTPRVMINELNQTHISTYLKARRVLGALRRGKLPQLVPRFLPYCADKDLECQVARDANVVIAICGSIGRRLTSLWNLDPSRVRYVPNPYEPPRELLQIPVQRNCRRVMFVGRIEPRKGVIELAQAIPRVLRANPDVQFRFVGRPHPSPDKRGTMTDYLLRELRRYQDNVEFTGSVSYDELPKYFAETDVCVFPSRWENFPYVCLEAMSAGCGIVASREGGMYEQLDAGRCGILIDPKSPDSIAAGIITLMENPQERMRMAQAARERLLSEYSFEKLGPIYEQYYQQAIDDHRNRVANESISVAS